MAALPDARQMFAARVLSLGVAAAAAFALSGCGVDYASSDPAFPGDFQERHPIVVAAAPTSVDLYPVGGALDQRSMANLRAFVERYRHYGSGAVTILRPWERTQTREPFTWSVARSTTPVLRARSPLEPICSQATAQRRRCACHSRGSRRSFRRHAASGRRTWPRDHRSRGGRMNPTRTSAARPNR